MNPVAGCGKGEGLAKRRLLAAIGLATLALFASGCAEAIKGPRVVIHTDTNFYVRSTVFTGPDAIGEIASDVCRQVDRQAVLTDTYRDVPFGLRYSTFACLGSGPALNDA